jgi:hypothetical protein
MGHGSAAFVERQSREERGRGDGRDAVDELLLYNMPLRTRQAQLVITTVFLLGVSQLFMLRMAAGVDQRNQNRLGLSALPLLGALVQRTYGAADFRSDNRIGAVYAEGSALFVFLFPELMLNPQVRQLVFFNTLYSYLLRDSYQAANWQALAALMPAFCAIETVRRMVNARLSGGPSASSTPAISSAAIGPAEMDAMVLGGLVSDEGQGNGVPVLRDVPLLKTLFGGHVHKSEDDQLLILVRPSIVVGDSERS